MKYDQTNYGVVRITSLLILMFMCTGTAFAGEKYDTIYIQKNASLRSRRINIYADADQKVVFFSVRGSEAKVYELYIFDVDGRLVKQAETRNRQTTIIKGIQKGVYLYEVFSDDKRIGNGQISIR